MTDADRLVLEDLILHHAFGRHPEATRSSASFFREKDCPAGTALAKEFLEAAQDTASAIERNFNLQRIKPVT